MEQNIENIYLSIIKELNENEKKHSEYLIYTERGFFKYQQHFNKKNLCLNIKIKDNRKNDFINILNSLNIIYTIYNDNKYNTVFELNRNCNYIIIDYVVDSHITIPKSFLEHFGYKTINGKMVDYIEINNKTIESKKIKEYGAEYGYYNKFLEDFLSNNFETKIAMITKQINMFRNEKIKNIAFSKDMIEDIYNFFDITTYRSPKMLKNLNEQSLSSILTGGYSHEDWLSFAISRNMPHIYNDLKLNIIINKTERDFIINDTMISSAFCDSGNEIVILPINKKECFVLMEEEYYKKYIVNGHFYFMNIENEKDVEMINKYIYRYAKQHNENVIGTREELEILLK